MSIKKDENVEALLVDIKQAAQIQNCKSDLNRYIQDVTDLDKEFGLTPLWKLSSQNLSFIGLNLAGEAGELANVIKKLQRDAESEELWEQFDEELVDVMIFVCELIHMTKMDFNAAWEKKHKELYERFEAKGVTQPFIDNKPYRLRR